MSLLHGVGATHTWSTQVVPGPHWLHASAGEVSLTSLAAYHLGIVPTGAVALPANAEFTVDPPVPAKQERGILLGYFGANGDMDTCIALRTAVIKDDVLYIQAGGVGIDLIEEEGVRVAFIVKHLELLARLFVADGGLGVFQNQGTEGIGVSGLQLDGDEYGELAHGGSLPDGLMTFAEYHTVS